MSRSLLRGSNPPSTAEPWRYGPTSSGPITCCTASATASAGSSAFLGVLHRARLADDRPLDLPRVLHRLLDLLRDVAREPRRLQVVELVGLHDDAHLAARLDRERLLDALEAVRDAFQLLEPLDVVRDDLAPRARAGRADGVGGRDERAHHRHGLDVTVVADDAVDDVLREPIALEELSADDGVRALDLVVDGLADVVQQPRALHRLRVVAGLGREHPRDVGDLDGVAQHVLPVRGAEVQPPEQLHEVRMQPADADLVDRGFGSLLHDLVDLSPRLRDHLLDARGVDASVDEQALQRALRDLAADGIEPRDDHRLGRVVDDEVDAGERLEGADVPSLAADDPALHVVARQRHDGDTVLGRVLGGVPLERHRDDVARSLVRPLPGLGLELADLPVREVAHLFLDPLEEERPRLVHGQRGDARQLGPLLLLDLGGLRPLCVHFGLPLAQPAVALLHLGDLLVELLVLLVEARLEALELGPALAVLRFGGLGDLESLVFGLEDDLLLLRARLRDEALGVRSRGGLARERERAAEQESDPEAHKTRDEGDEAHDEDVGHVEGPFRARVREDARRSGASAPAFSTQVAEAANAANHHPDIHVEGYNKVRVVLTTHATGGISDADVALAKEIDKAERA